MLALVTATRNSMSTLPQTLDSVDLEPTRVKQFFIDGASTDGTIKYLHAFAAEAKDVVIQAQNGMGLYEALNQGIQAALIDPDVTHIGMLHSDDRLLPESYKEYLSEIDRNPADVFYSDIGFHDSTGEVVRIWRSGSFSRFKLNTGWMPPHTSIIVSSSVYRDLGLYNPEFGTAADYEWIVRVLSSRSENVCYFPKRTLTMLAGGASSASIRARLRANAMDGKVWSDRSRIQAALIRLCKPLRKVGQFLVLKESG